MPRKRIELSATAAAAADCFRTTPARTNGRRVQTADGCDVISYAAHVDAVGLCGAHDSGALLRLSRAQHYCCRLLLGNDCRARNECPIECERRTCVCVVFFPHLPNQHAHATNNRAIQSCTMHHSHARPSIVPYSLSSYLFALVRTQFFFSRELACVPFLFFIFCYFPCTSHGRKKLFRRFITQRSPLCLHKHSRHESIDAAAAVFLFMRPT